MCPRRGTSCHASSASSNDTCTPRAGCHPYLDGNGRLGRLLVTLILEEWKLLSQPLPYLSLFFKRRREEYYRALNRVRTEGDWEGWTAFFIEGVATIAEEAVQGARELFALVGRARTRVLAAGKASVVASRLFEDLPRHPIVTITGVVKLLETTKPTAAKAVALLEDAGVLTETTGHRRDRTFSYRGTSTTCASAPSPSTTASAFTLSHEMS